MTLTTALSNASSGLTSAGIRANVASSNISNASTPGYVKRTVVSQEGVLGSRGAGVRANTIERSQDMQLTRARRDADATAGRSNQLAEAYSTLNRELGAPGADFGLFSSLETLESAFADLAATPESGALQNAVVFAAGETSDQFNSLAQSAQTLREDADRDIQLDVDTVNRSLYALQEVNTRISGVSPNSNEAAAFEDERQRLIDTISSIIPIKDIPRDHGQVDIMTEDGVFLLSGKVSEVSFNQSNTLPNTVRYPEISGSPSGLFVGTQDITPGGTGSQALTSGSLAGHFTVRDKIVPEFLDGLDSLAGDLITRFSDDSLDPTKAAGAPGVFTDNGGAFDPLNRRGVADRISLNIAIDPANGGEARRIRDGMGSTAAGEVGDSTIITGLLSAMTNGNPAPAGISLSGNYSVSSLSAGFSSIISEQALRNDAVNTGATARQETLLDSEIAGSAVDTDQELQSLLLIEQSYAANARVIQTVSDMIDRLLQI